jgi:hypothetical protein
MAHGASRRIAACEVSALPGEQERWRLFYAQNMLPLVRRSLYAVHQAVARVRLFHCEVAELARR